MGNKKSRQRGAESVTGCIATMGEIIGEIDWLELVLIMLSTAILLATFRIWLF